MSTFLMFGSYSSDSIGKISAARTDEAKAFIEQQGGTVTGGYALLGEKDLVLIVDLPDTESAVKASVGLSKMLGISFATHPAVTVETFDRITAGM
jgi:uncharacterized protein with GYD domain